MMGSPIIQPKPRGRPSMGLGEEKTDIKLGPTRKLRLRQRAAFETKRNQEVGLRRCHVSLGEMVRRCVDHYLALYPPPEERPQPILEEIRDEDPARIVTPEMVR